MYFAEIIPVQNTKSRKSIKADKAEVETKQKDPSLDPVQIVNNLLKENSLKPKKNQKNDKHNGNKEETVREKRIKKNNSKRRVENIEHKEETSEPHFELFEPNEFKVFKDNRFKNMRNSVCLNVDVSVVKPEIVNSKIVRETEDSGFTGLPEEKIFEEGFTYKGKKLPKRFMDLKVENVLHVMKSLDCLFANDQTKDKHMRLLTGKKKKNHMSNEMRESFRQHKMIEKAFKFKEPGSKALLQNYFCQLLSVDDEQVVKAFQVTKYPKGYNFTKSPEIFLDEFSKQQVSYRDDPIMFGSEPNFLYNCINEDVIPNGEILSMKSLKSRLKNFVEEQYPVTVWQGLLEKHLPLLTKNDVDSFIQGKYVEEGKEIRVKKWWINFIPAHHFYLTCNNVRRLASLFLEKLYNLRNKIIMYAVRYYHISKLLPYQRKELFSKRSKMFAELMQTPRIQGMFLAGRTHEEVTSLVHSECTVSINAEIDKILRTKTEDVTYSTHRVSDYDEFEMTDFPSVCVKREKPISFVKKLSVKQTRDGVQARYKSVYPTLLFVKRNLDFPNTADYFYEENWNRAVDQYYEEHSINKWDKYTGPTLVECGDFSRFIALRSIKDLSKYNKWCREQKLIGYGYKSLQKSRFRKESFSTFVSTSLNLVILVGAIAFNIILFTFDLRNTVRELLIQPILARLTPLQDTVNAIARPIAHVANAHPHEFRQVISLPRQIFDFSLSYYNQVKLLELKTLCHVVYHISNGNKAAALEWASNFVISRYNQLPRLLEFVNDNRSLIFKASAAAFVVYGVSVAPEVYTAICQAYDSGKDVTDFVKLNAIDTFETESGSIGTFLKPLLSMFVSQEVNNLNSFSIREMNQKWQLINHQLRAYQEIINGAETFIVFVLKYLFGYDIHDRAQQQFNEKVLEMMDYFIEIRPEQTNIKNDRNRLLEILIKSEEAHALRTNPRFAGLPSYMCSYYDKLLSQFTVFSKECSDLHRGTNQRKEPVCILFTGAPETGKTTSSNFLMQALSHSLYKKQFDASMLFTFNKHSEFYEGYHNQPFVLIDDLFASEDVNDRRNEAGALIGMINSAPFALPMAFESKGSMFFNSDFVFCSTNAANNGINHAELQIGMTDPNAVKRRFHWCLHATEKYLGKNPWQIFMRVDKAPRKFQDLVGKKITMRQFCLRLADDFNQRNIPSTLTQADFKHIFEECVDDEVVENEDPDSTEELPPINKMSALYKKHTSKLKVSLNEKQSGPIVDRDRDKKVADGESSNGTWKGTFCSLPKMADFFPNYDQLNNKTTETDSPTFEPKLGSPEQLDSDHDGKFLSFLDFNAKKHFSFFYKIFVQSCKDTAYCFEGLPSFCTPNAAAVLFSTLVVAYGSYKAYNWFNSGTIFEAESHTKRFAPTRAKSANKLRIKRAVNATKRRFRSFKFKWMDKRFIKQTLSIDATNSITKSAKGTVHLYAAALDRNGELKTREVCTGFHLKDGIIVTVAHFLLNFRGEEDMYIMMKYKDVITEIDIDSVEFIVDLDLCFMRMPKKSQLPPAMYKYLITEQTDHVVYDGMPLVMVSTTPSGTPIFKEVTKINGPSECNYSIGVDKVVVHEPIAYKGETSPGQSGSMLFMHDLQNSPLLIGIHCGVALGDREAYRIALPIWKEFIDQLLCDIGWEQEASSAEKITIETESCSFPLKILKEVPPNLAYTHSKQSKIIRSPLWGAFGNPDYIPCKLSKFTNSKGMEIDPALDALKKFRQEDFPGRISDGAFDYLKKLYPRNGKPEIFPYDKAVNGDSTYNIPSIRVSTSAGYPICLEQTKGKSKYIRFDDDKFVVDESFLEKVKLDEEKLRRGEQIEVIWADCLKDETRERAKVDAGKTRIFSSCPLHYLLLVRRYFLAFIAEIQRHCVQKPVAVGINVHSVDWQMLYQRLSQKARSIVAGDFSRYDTSLCTAFAKFFVKFVNWWYNDGPENSRVRELLFEHVYHAVHIFGSVMFVLAMGNPSGNPLTAIYNSITNIAATYTVLVDCLGLKEDEFEITCYGDDNVIAIDRPNFRCCDLTPHYKERFGLEYTHYSKSDVEPYDTLETIRYLGRKFWACEGMMKAPLEERVVLEMIYWIRGKQAKEDKLLSTISAFAIETSHFGCDRFHELKEELFLKIEDMCPEIYPTVDRNYQSYGYYHKGMYDPRYFVKFAWYESSNCGKSKLETLMTDCDEVAVIDFIKERHYAKRAYRCESVNQPWQQVKWTCRRNPVNYEVREDNEETRETHIPEDTQGTRIGTFADVSTLVHATPAGPTSVGPHNLLNFEEYDLSQSLSRVYEVAVCTWTEAQAMGTELASISFPKALFTQPFVANIIGAYTYFTGSVRVSFRMSSSKYIYGKVIASANPYPITSTTDADVYGMAGLPHVLISAAEASTVVMDIPFISIRRALIIQNHFADEIARVKIRVLNPLRNTDGTTASAVLTVQAQFVNPKVSLPMSFEPQSLKEANVKSEHNSVSSVFEAKRGKPFSVRMHKVSKTVAPILKAAGKAVAIAKTAMEVGETVATALAVVGLDKPPTQDRTTMVTSVPDQDLMTANGVAHSISVGHMVEHAVSVDPLIPGEGDVMKLTNICMVPSLVMVATMINGTLPLPLCIAGPLVDQGSNFRPAYVDWVSNQFLYVSGTMKYKIYVTAGLFQAIRIVLFLCPDEYDATLWQDCYHKVYDIQGDTEIEFSLPYMCQNVMNSTRFPDKTPCVWVQILSWSTPNPTVSAPIYLNVYKSGGPDMQFGTLLEKTMVLESNPRADFAQDFEYFDHHMKSYETDGLVIGEKIESVREIVHRMAPYGTMAPNSFVRPYTFTATNNTFIHLEMWGSIFKFYRGSIRVAVLPKTCTQNSALVVRVPQVAGYPSYNLPFAKYGDKNMGLMQIEAPHFAAVPLLPTRQGTNNSMPHPLEVVLCGKPGDNFVLMKGGGDDFSFSFLMPPTKLPTTTPTTMGVSSLQTYFQT